MNLNFCHIQRNVYERSKHNLWSSVTLLMLQRGETYISVELQLPKDPLHEWLWCSDTKTMMGGKLKNLKKNLSRCQGVHHKPHTAHGINPALQSETLESNHPRHGMAYVTLLEIYITLKENKLLLTSTFRFQVLLNQNVPETELSSRWSADKIWAKVNHT